MDRSRILATTDLTAKSLKVIDKAISYALASDSWLEVLHVAEPKMFAFGLGDKNPDAPVDNEQLRAISDRIKAGLGRKIDKMNVETRLGDVAETTLAYAKEKRAELIIIGQGAGLGGLATFFLGTTTKQIVTDSPVSTLIVKTVGDSKYKTIYAPVDFTDETKRAIAQACGRFGGARLILEHLVETPSELQSLYYGFNETQIEAGKTAFKLTAEKQMQTFLETLKAEFPSVAKAGIETRVSLSEIHPENIIKKASDLGADLIVLPAKAERGSRAYDILEFSSIDLLMAKQ
ncbi:MAG: universal stress protein [Helicobacteraceae bacterium]|jgi:nucleotide-binding universal stress UspA family protein|nr:universal stress protein [Helicobacteraceae bacterium]